MMVKIVQSTRNRCHSGVVLLLLTALLILPAVVSTMEKPAFSLCIFKALFGVPCAGCGMTRAFAHLGHGNVVQALSMNPSSLIVYAIIVLIWINVSISFFVNKEIKIDLTKRERIVAVSLSALLMMSAWIYNLFFNTNLKGG